MSTCDWSSVIAGNFTLPPFSNSDYRVLELIARDGLQHTSKPKRIVIVGAGIAGLVAGHTLKAAGYHVTILEASHGIGGRIQTYQDKREGWLAELGAMRVPEIHTLVSAYLQKFELPLYKFQTFDSDSFYYVNGVLKRTGRALQYPDSFRYKPRGWEHGKSGQQLLKEALCPAIQELRTRGWKFVVNKYSKLSEMDYFKMVGLSQEAIKMINLDHCCLSRSILGVLLDVLYFVSPVNYHGVAGGMKKLAEAFLPELNKNIMFNARVTRIDQKGKDGVMVRFKDSVQDSYKDIACYYVIVTASPPVTLQIEFIPNVSQSKLKALRDTVLYPATKVFIYFSEPFWEKDNITGGHSLTDMLPNDIYYPSPGDSRTRNVLLASYTRGEKATKMPGSDNECIDICLQTLSKIHRMDVRKLFVGGVVKRWAQDEFTKGAFSLFDPKSYTIMIQPENRVFFAGEHASRSNSWIEGAIESALRASMDIDKINST